MVPNAVCNLMLARSGIEAHDLIITAPYQGISSVMRTPIALPPNFSREGGSGMLRARSHPHTFAERLADQKARLEQKAARLKPGPERNCLLEKVKQIDVDAEVHEWLTSPSQQAPK